MLYRYEGYDVVVMRVVGKRVHVTMVVATAVVWSEGRVREGVVISKVVARRVVLIEGCSMLVTHLQTGDEMQCYLEGCCFSQLYVCAFWRCYKGRNVELRVWGYGLQALRLWYWRI